MLGCESGCGGLGWLLTLTGISCILASAGAPGLLPTSLMLVWCALCVQEEMRIAAAHIGHKPSLLFPTDNHNAVSRLRDLLANQGLAGPSLLLVAEMVAYGDGGMWVDRIVTPIFTFLAHEVRQQLPTIT